MSHKNSEPSERRLSVNGKNAYLIFNAEYTNTQNITHDTNYNKHYLTSKPLNRARSCSPALLECEKISTQTPTSNVNTHSLIPTTTTQQTYTMHTRKINRSQIEIIWLPVETFQ